MRAVLPSSLGPKSQQGQQLGEIDETLSFGPFRSRERFSSVLAVQQLLQAVVHPLRQSESVKIGWHFGHPSYQFSAS